MFDLLLFEILKRVSMLRFKSLNVLLILFILFAGLSFVSAHDNTTQSVQDDSILPMNCMASKLAMSI